MRFLASGALRALRRTRLSIRLPVLTALLTTAVVCGSFTALSVQVRTSTRRVFADELARNQRTLVALQRDSRRHLVLSAALLAESPSLRSAIATYRVEGHAGQGLRQDLTSTVQHELERLGRDLAGGTLLATDEQGRVFASYVREGRAPAPGTDLSALTAVHNALDANLVDSGGDPYLAALELDSAYYAVGVAPLILDGYTIGTLIFGERVGEATVAQLRATIDGDVIVTAGPKVVAATLPPAVASRVALDARRGGPMRIGHDEILAAPI
ncbi:MAG: hypothetical protein JWN53_223, partial [Gemmatimonadetes bacterium]|nr:hypothetical protein [Gemmatimonadota bacterium]